MRNSIDYEWLIEWVDCYGDIHSIEFEDAGNLSVLIAGVEFDKDNEHGLRPRVVAVYNLGNDDDGLLERGWCYPVNGVLGSHFCDAYDNHTRRVPKKITTEFINSING